MKKKIAPSIMCAPFFELKKCVKELEDSGVDYIHIDITVGK